MANNSQYPGIQPPRAPVAPMGPPQSAYPSVQMQFRPAGPPRPPPPYISMASQQFLTLGRPNIGLPSQSQQLQLSQPMQHLPPRPGLPPHSIVPPPPPLPVPTPQAFSVPDGQPSRPVLSVSPQAQQAVPVPNNYIPGPNGPRAALSVTYTLSTSATVQIHVNAEAANQYQQSSSANMPSFPLGGPAWPADGQTTKAVTPSLQPAEQLSVVPSVPVTVDAPKAAEKAPSDWIEHTKSTGQRQGKRYYYNKKTKVSTWEKPLDLMSPIERADASTDWKELLAPNGQKYYYNKSMRKSKWIMPDELKLAREHLKNGSTCEEQASIKDHDNEMVVPSISVVSLALNTDGLSSQAHDLVSSPVSVAPTVAAAHSGSLVTSELPTGSIANCKATTINAAEGQAQIKTVPIPSEETAVPATLLNLAAPALSNTEDILSKLSVTAENRTPAGTIEEYEKGTVVNLGASVAAVEEKTVDQETPVYENKQDAKNAFKGLLENANIASDWTWDQAMRVIINDRRYGALRTLSEKKQAFNEFVGQKKKQEAEERRNKQKKAREEFRKMLEDSKEITASTKWSKAIAIFEDDDRFKAVERSKDREDLFEDHLVELEKKERSKALEKHKRNRKEYIEFLKSCDFITASSQWRKVQDRLEADESCLRLEKVDRLEIFQEYVRDLEKEEEEQRKQRMEELRKMERKNRDEFRKLMEGHIASGMLTSKTHWRDYCIKVKEFPAYLAVSSNSSGATPKDLFEDVIEELEKQYLEDRDLIKETVKMRKVSISSTWTLEEFKSEIADDISSHAVSDVNLKLVFDELQERARERDEKEAKRRKRLADDFYVSLSTSKEITSSSRWEEFKSLFEDRLESWFTVEESFFMEIFEKYIAELKKARDERKRREDKAKKSMDRDRRSEKSRREKDRGKKDKHRKDETESDKGEENRRSGKKQQHRKRHHGYPDDMSMDDDDKDRAHRHSSERKRTKQLEQQSVDYESRHKRYKRDRQKEAEDGEVW